MLLDHPLTSADSGSINQFRLLMRCSGPNNSMTSAHVSELVFFVRKPYVFLLLRYFGALGARALRVVN
eukprot:scaffold24167_cov26-Tisochrysis_lutea.AAC.1